MKICVCGRFCEIGFLLRWEADFLISGAHADFLAGLIVPVWRFGKSGRQVLSGGIVCPAESLIEVRRILEAVGKR